MAKNKRLGGKADKPASLAVVRQRSREQLYTEGKTIRDRFVVRILNKVLVVCAIFLTGCASYRNAATNRFISQGTLALQDTENRDEISYWNGTESEGKPRIVIDLDQQRAYFYKGDQIVGVSVVSTGREGYDTPPVEIRHALAPNYEPSPISERYSDFPSLMDR